MPLRGGLLAAHLGSEEAAQRWREAHEAEQRRTLLRNVLRDQAALRAESRRSSDEYDLRLEVRRLRADVDRLRGDLDRLEEELPEAIACRREVRTNGTTPPRR
jgi:hypothetical protein